MKEFEAECCMLCAVCSALSFKCTELFSLFHQICGLKSIELPLHWACFCNVNISQLDSNLPWPGTSRWANNIFDGESCLHCKILSENWLRHGFTHHISMSTAGVRTIQYKLIFDIALWKINNFTTLSAINSSDHSPLKIKYFKSWINNSCRLQKETGT